MECHLNNIVKKHFFKYTFFFVIKRKREIGFYWSVSSAESISSRITEIIYSHQTKVDYTDVFTGKINEKMFRLGIPPSKIQISRSLFLQTDINIILSAK